MLLSREYQIQVCVADNIGCVNGVQNHQVQLLRFADKTPFSFIEKFTRRWNKGDADDFVIVLSVLCESPDNIHSLADVKSFARKFEKINSAAIFACPKKMRY
ncbi:MAG TPA: hypothetical protein DCP03_10290 [Polaromonas sp.]|nr:hypothetical protein [Polaromonas sp.]